MSLVRVLPPAKRQSLDVRESLESNSSGSSEDESQETGGKAETGELEALNGSVCCSPSRFGDETRCRGANAFSRWKKLLAYFDLAG